MTQPPDEFEFFFEKPWSDGLPVVIPTEDRIARMLSGTRRGPEESLGPVPPLMEEATVRSVAVHAVMAGCKPEYLPVVLAGLEAMLEDSFNLNGIQGTLNSVAPLLIVNGPYTRKIGLHGGSGCFGPGFRANATIGRAIRLMLLNLGGGIPMVASMSTFGQPSRYTYCIAENEAESPWEPLSVTKGSPPGADAVTVVACENPQLVVDDGSRGPESLCAAIADAMAHLGSWNLWTRTDLVVALSPQQAAICARAGWSKADVHRRLMERAGRPLGDLKKSGHYRPERMVGLPIDLDDDGAFVPALRDPSDLHVIVAGGVPGPHSALMHGWSGGSRSVHRRYEP
ncbi:MAG: hypothetical protein HYZ11_09280 [Candidatus Tectomicrobia bacterium]|uniref:Thioredoxin n=1 Tax=Tectimicrobiota bacterium TaxID=2528274 RepID=A0A932MNN9_UNCTE|nr:hypothetical protein [Candidatus Tectomicrobia bacterium]